MTNIVQNEWQYGLCECYRNPGTCCKVFCCSPCVVCNNGEAVEKDGCLWCLISCCLPDIASALFRSSAREKYGIEGDECEDWVSLPCSSLLLIVSTFCSGSGLLLHPLRHLSDGRGARGETVGDGQQLNFSLSLSLCQTFLNISK